MNQFNQSNAGVPSNVYCTNYSDALQAHLYKEQINADICLGKNAILNQQDIAAYESKLKAKEESEKSLLLYKERLKQEKDCVVDGLVENLNGELILMKMTPTGNYFVSKPLLTCKNLRLNVVKNCLDINDESYYLSWTEGKSEIVDTFNIGIMKKLLLESKIIVLGIGRDKRKIFFERLYEYLMAKRTVREEYPHAGWYFVDDVMKYIKEDEIHNGNNNI